MKLVSYNIQYGFGADGRYDLSRAAAVVAGADIIALQEVERFWKRSNEDDQPAMLARLLPDHYQVYGPAFDMDASFRDDRGAIVNRRRQFGAMILSRLPIEWSRLHLLPMRRTVAPLNTQNAALECMIRTPSGPVRFLSIHLAHIGAEERLEEIDFLLERHRRTGLEGGPWSGVDDEPERGWSNGELEPAAPDEAIWLGDFNCEPGSSEYRRIVGDNPYHRNARYKGGFTDAATVIEPAGGLHTHIKTIDGVVRKRRLDHCFVSSALAHRVTGAQVDVAATASDHFPLWVDIDLETPAGSGEWTLAVFLAVLAAAAMHAIWNAMVKVRLDRFASVTLMTVGMAVTALPALPFVAFPSAGVWPWIIASVILHMGYKLSLIRAYAAGDLAQTYPLARGTAPLMTTVGAIFLVAEFPSTLAIGGIALLSAGTLLMSMRGGLNLEKLNRHAVGFALATSVFIAGYTLTDGNGARLASTASSYAAWLFLCDGVWSLALALILRGPAIVPAMTAEWKTGIVTGFLSATAYWIVMWAMTKAPIASVAALRESSILFAMLISVFALKETLSGWRLGAASMIVCGVVLLRLG